MGIYFAFIFHQFWKVFFYFLFNLYIFVFRSEFFSFHKFADFLFWLFSPRRRRLALSPYEFEVYWAHRSLCGHTLCWIQVYRGIYKDNQQKVSNFHLHRGINVGNSDRIIIFYKIATQLDCLVSTIGSRGRGGECLAVAETEKQ